jgi:radical SAM superfamily enzyme with C-terminal helix-hairpin-helix motif
MSITLQEIFEADVKEIQDILKTTKKDIAILRKNIINDYLKKEMLSEEAKFIVEKTNFLNEDLTQDLENVLYKCLNESLTDEFDVSKRNIIKEIQRYGKDFDKVYNKAMQKKNRLVNNFTEAIDLINENNNMATIQHFQDFFDRTQRDWGYYLE